MKGYVTAVGDINSAQMAGIVFIHYFNEVRAIDNGIQFITVNLNIIAYISQLHHNRRIGLGIDVFMIISGGIVKEVQGTFITSHISFIQ